MRNPAAGFTLIEVLVALAIAGMGLGFLVHAAGIGLGNADLAHRYIEATSRARSHLAEAGRDGLAPGTSGGDDGGGYTWRLRIGPPVMHGPAAGDPQTPLALYPVDVTISWQSGMSRRQIMLRTQRTRRVPQ